MIAGAPWANGSGDGGLQYDMDIVRSRLQVEQNAAYATVCAGGLCLLMVAACVKTRLWRDNGGQAKGPQLFDSDVESMHEEAAADVLEHKSQWRNYMKLKHTRLKRLMARRKARRKNNKSGTSEKESYPLIVLDDH